MKKEGGKGGGGGENEHVAAVVLTSNMNDGAGFIVPFGFGMKPVSTPVEISSSASIIVSQERLHLSPAAILTQGLSKVDWVRVWFFAMKTKLTLSPTAATMESGV